MTLFLAWHIASTRVSHSAWYRPVEHPIGVARERVVQDYWEAALATYADQLHSLQQAELLQRLNRRGAAGTAPLLDHPPRVNVAARRWFEHRADIRRRLPCPCAVCRARDARYNRHP